MTFLKIPFQTASKHSAAAAPCFHTACYNPPPPSEPYERKPIWNKPFTSTPTARAKATPARAAGACCCATAATKKNCLAAKAETTNNRMELTAVIEALKALKRTSRVEICTDSQYVKNGMQSWIHGWKKNGWKPRPNSR